MLRLDDVSEPHPGDGELLVRVRACAINYPDVLIIEDKYQVRPPRPFAPGGEIAGEVEAAGDGVEGWDAGDRLIAVTGFGGLAEKAVIPAKAAIRLPAERSFAEEGLGIPPAKEILGGASCWLKPDGDACAAEGD